MRRFLLINGLVLLFSAWACAEFAIEDDGARLTVFEHGKAVLVYNCAMVDPPEGVAEDRRRQGYVHPLYGLDGEVLTQDFPDDHHHHRGVFWAWPDTSVGGRKMDIWTLGGARTVHERFTAREAGEEGALISVQNLWVFDEAPDDPKFRETVCITVHPAGEKVRAIDFRLVFENICQEEAVLRGSAGKEGLFGRIKGYGGFCFRPDAERNPMRFTSAAGKVRHDVLRLKSPWVDLSFPKKKGEDEMSGLAIFQHPSNPGYPHPGWILRHYGFLGQSWPCDQSHALQPGERVELRYRILVHRGDGDSANVSEVFQKYVESEGPASDESLSRTEVAPRSVLSTDGIQDFQGNPPRHAVRLFGRTARVRFSSGLRQPEDGCQGAGPGGGHARGHYKKGGTQGWAPDPPGCRRTTGVPAL